MEMLISEAEEQLKAALCSCGVCLQTDLSPAGVEFLKQLNHHRGQHTLCFINFSDGTYLVACHTRVAEHQLAALRDDILRAGHVLHLEKCGFLAVILKRSGSRSTMAEDMERRGDERIQAHRTLYAGAGWAHAYGAGGQGRRGDRNSGKSVDSRPVAASRPSSSPASSLSQMKPSAPPFAIQIRTPALSYSTAG